MQEKKPRGEHAWMAQYMTPEYEARFPSSGVSKYAREHGLSWDQAKSKMPENGLYVPL